MNLLLASNSPRRKELLNNLGYDFKVVSIDCDEIYPKDLSVPEVAGYLSLLKANSYSDLKENEALITADTIVVLENEVLGKPKSETDAKEMLRQLSGKKHQVYTGFTLKTLEKTITETDVAHVDFAPFSEGEIEYYVSKFQPLDKAGSYGIQEWIGMAKICKIEGSYYTIMGFPTHLVYEKLASLF